jgi:hypothetical protein
MSQSSEGIIHHLRFNKPSSPPPPNLGPLVAFSGTFTGPGINFIFRPQNAATPTPLLIPQPTSDNILEINLTLDSIAFSTSLGSVPNRGEVQGDIFLNGVPYLQTVQDVTDPHHPVGIHFEPGIWLIVPPTTAPAVAQSTLVRQASIPHGTTIEAQGTFTSISGPPNIPSVDITPFKAGQPDIPANQITFPSQTAAESNTARIPQDLTPFIAAGTITQAILSDPNTMLRNALANGPNVTATTIIQISTNPAPPIPIGGGVDDIAFLLNDDTTPNADAISMAATFWIETLEFGGLQIQYSQLVILNFHGLSWPHVSLATLTRREPA